MTFKQFLKLLESDLDLQDLVADNDMTEREAYEFTLDYMDMREFDANQEN